MPFDYKASWERNQALLIDFIKGDLALGRTFVESALLAKISGRKDYSEQAVGGALRAAETIRLFLDQVADEPRRKHFAETLAELERLIGSI